MTFTSPSRRARAVALLAVLMVLLAACRAGDGTETTAEGGGGSGAQGITEDQIKIGGSFPFSGPLASAAALSQGAAAYFAEVNATGGVNGRQIVYTPLDDAYDPSRTASNARQLVQQEQVFALLQYGGPGLATRDYLETQGVPQFVFAGNEPYSEVDEYSYTRALWPDVRLESATVAQHVLSENPDAQIGVLGINNDFTVSVVAGVEIGLGDKVDQLVAVERFEPTATDLSGQVNILRAAGVDALVTTLTGPLAPAVEYIRQTGWDVPIYNYSNATSKLAFLDLVSPGAAMGLRQARWFRDPADAALADDPEIQAYREIVADNGANPDDALVLNGYGLAQAFVAALTAMEEPTQEALVAAWDDLPETESVALPEGVVFRPVPGGRVVGSYEVVEWDGSSWQPLTPVVDAIAQGFLEG